MPCCVILPTTKRSCEETSSSIGNIIILSPCVYAMLTLTVGVVFHILCMSLEFVLTVCHHQVLWHKVRA